MKEYKVGVVGAPNTGKTTIFNYLSGKKEKVGNWSGTTVERIEGKVNIKGKNVIFVDIPGIYSLHATSTDEKIARDFIMKEKPDLVVVVLNASDLYHSLYVFTEIFELGINVVVALNMVDSAHREGIKVDTTELSRILGVPVVETIGFKGKGIPELRNTIYQSLDKKTNPLYIEYPKPIEDGIQEITRALDHKNVKFSFLNERAVAVEILERNEFVVNHVVVANNLWEDISKVMRNVEENLRRISSDDVDVAIVRTKYKFIDQVLKKVVHKEKSVYKSFGDKVDNVITNKYVGIPLFLAIMFGIFSIVYYLGEPISGWIEEEISLLSRFITDIGKSNGWNEILISFLTDGFLSGIGAVLVFLPYIVILFLLVGIMENSGFLARSALVMDKIMSKFGLHGKSFLPMLIGFGCNIPGILATRTLSSEKDRIVTILILPFMTCPARLFVITVVAIAIFGSYSPIVMISMYVIGILLAIFSAKIFRRVLFKGELSLFVIELPKYRLPSLKVLLSDTWMRTWIFLKNMGTVIAGVVILVWFLGSIPFGVGYGSKNSLLGIIGNFIKPLFYLNGYGSWEVSVAIISGILARETVIATLGTVYGVSEDGITNVLSNVFNPISGISFLVFIQIAMLCIATFKVTSSEIGLKWGIFSFFYTILLAWVLSVIVYQIGILIF